MQPVKQEALNTIGQLPEDVDMDEIMYRLYVVDKIRKGQQAVEDDQTISHEDMKKEIDKWQFGLFPQKIDLRQIYNSIAYDSKIYAKRVTQNIAAKPDILDGLPCIGKVVDELKDDKIRELPIYTYRIIYEVRTDDVFILAVMHKRQDLQPESIESRL